MPSTYFFLAATLLLSLNFVRPLGLAISDWLYFVSLGLVLIETAFLKREDWACWTKNRFILPAGLVLFGALISTSRALDVVTAGVEIIQHLYIITIFVSLTWVMVRRGHTKLIIGAFILSGLFSALVALVDYFSGSTYGLILSGTPDAQWWYRYTGTLGHPNKFGYFLVLTSLLTFATFSVKKKAITRWVGDVVLAIQLFAIYLSASVTAYLGIVIGLGFLIYSIKGLQLKILKIGMPIVFIGMPIIIALQILDIKNPFPRVQIGNDNLISLSIDRVEVSTADSRLEIYRQAWVEIVKSPFVGVGFDQISTSGINSSSRYLNYAVHNALLQLFYTGGFFAFTGWLFIYVYIGLISLKLVISKSATPLRLGLAAGTLSILLMDQFQDSIYEREKWLVIALLVSWVWLNEYSKENSA